MAGNFLDGILDAVIGFGYMNFYPVANSPDTVSPYANQMVMQNRYMQGKTAFNDIQVRKKLRALRENAQKFNIPADVVDTFYPLLAMLVKADTPEIRQKIRGANPYFGPLLLQVFDALIDTEPGVDRIYAGMANTYGSAKGNETAVFAANQMDLLIRGLEPNANGLRRASATSIGATLQELQKTGFNYEVAAGLNRDDFQAFDSAYSNLFNSSKYQDVKAWAQRSYISDIASSTSDKDERKMLVAMDKAIREGENIDDVLKAYVGEDKKYKNITEIKDKYLSDIAITEYAKLNSVQMQSHFIKQELHNLNDSDNKFVQSFKEFAKERGVEDISTADASKVSELKNLYTDTIVNDLTKKDRQYADLTRGTMLERIGVDLEQDSRSKMGPVYDRVQSLNQQILRENDWRLAVGLTTWEALSPEQQQQYQDMYGGGKEGRTKAQIALATGEMNKYAQAAMSRLDTAEAAAQTLAIKTAAARAGISDEQLSKQAAFIGSMVRDKNLLSSAIHAHAAWQAAARDQGIRLSEPMVLEGAQKEALITNSSEHKAMLMFAKQKFKPGSELYELQQAVLSGTMTPEQKKKFDDYLRHPGNLIADVARATNKTPDALKREMLYVDERSIRTDQMDNLLNTEFNAMWRMAGAERIGKKSNLERNLQMSDEEAKALGIGSDGLTKAGLIDITSTLITKDLANATEFWSGELTEVDFKRLRDAGYDDIASRGEQRSKLRSQITQEVLKEEAFQGMKEDNPDVINEVNRRMGKETMRIGISSSAHDKSYADYQGKMTRIDVTSKAVKDENGNMISTTEANRRGVTTNFEQAGVTPRAAQQDALGMVADVYDKSAEGMRSPVREIREQIKGIWAGGGNIVGEIGKLMLKSMFGFGGSANASDTDKQKPSSEKSPKTGSGESGTMEQTRIGVIEAFVNSGGEITTAIYNAVKDGVIDANAEVQIT